MMITAFVWGALSDTWGRKWLLIFAFLSLAVVGAVSAMVTSSLAYLVLRLISGTL